MGFWENIFICFLVVKFLFNTDKIPMFMIFERGILSSGKSRNGEDGKATKEQGFTKRIRKKEKICLRRML